MYGHFGEGCLHLRVGFGLDRPGGEDRLRRFMADGGGPGVAPRRVALAASTATAGPGRELLAASSARDASPRSASSRRSGTRTTVLNPGIIVDAAARSTPTCAGRGPRPDSRSGRASRSRRTAATCGGA